MKARLTSLGLVAGVMILGACAAPSGGGDLRERYGEAVALNNARQIAYKTPEDYLTDLSKVFAAETQDTVTFAFNKSNLDRTARKALNGQAAWLRANPRVRMTIIGHTDLVGTESYNDRLGLRRAKAVLNYLVRRGVSRSRLDAVASLGESEPVVETENRERRNRRAVTTVAGFVRNYVGDGMDARLAYLRYGQYRTGGVQVETAASDSQ